MGVFEVTKVLPSGAIEVWSESTRAFTVNGQWLKPYFVGQPIEKPLSIPSLIPFKHKGNGQALNLKRALLERQAKSFYPFHKYLYLYLFSLFIFKKGVRSILIGLERWVDGPSVLRDTGRGQNGSKVKIFRVIKGRLCSSA